ncbi:unnamed protein product [Diatraea saccharalis]|uniref:Uncharacterized protein n=1 Tax=Diatraea saccharalis TaxID=40085 RepID=A0A9N9WK53_9NEOP|nr:unnamed protein product [Diatraea saccharalis]
MILFHAGSLSTSIEATSYALSALSLCPKGLRTTSCASDARGAVRWLSAHRHAAGGFLSTQDTLVALEALSAWSTVQPSSPLNLTVKVRSRNDVKSTLIQAGDKVPQVMKMTTGDQLDVAVEGSGCVLVQASRSYHSARAMERGVVAGSARSLAVQVRVRTDGTFDCDANQTLCFCAAEIEACVRWAGGAGGMRVLEVRLPGAAAADAARLYSQLKPPHTLLRRIELTPSGGRATFYLDDTGIETETEGHACYYVHAVAPKTKTKPAYARVTDYYNPTINHTQMYTIPEDCPPRIAHENNEFIASDNLFNKARSLSDSSEIVITHEYSFEDIPEGIPLEDPIYDTFNRDEIAYLTKHNEMKHNTANDKIHINKINNETIEKIANFEEKKKSANVELVNTEFYQVTQKSIANYEESSVLHVRNLSSNESFDLIDNVERNTLIPLETWHDYSNSSSVGNQNDFESKDNTKKLNNYVPQTKNSINHETNMNSHETLSSKYDVTTTKKDGAISDIIENVGKSDVITHDYSIKGSSDVKKETTHMNIKVENPNLANWHVIDSPTDLEVPTGIEGPIPSVALPPPNFVLPPPDFSRTPVSYPRRFHGPPQNMYYFFQYDPSFYYRGRNPQIG